MHIFASFFIVLFCIFRVQTFKPPHKIFLDFFCLDFTSRGFGDKIQVHLFR